MAIDAVVRISFQSVPEANQSANRALVGVSQGDEGPGPFRRVATAAYSCFAGEDMAVASAIASLGNVIAEYGAQLDFVSISLVKHKQS